jgi:hypothetical protein
LLSLTANAKAIYSDSVELNVTIFIFVDLMEKNALSSPIANKNE